MSEILRAVLDATCVRSSPAFYSVAINTTQGIGLRQLGRRQTVLQMKSDTWFLMMAWNQFCAYDSAGVPQWELPTLSTTFQIQDMRTSEILSNSPIVTPNAGTNLNNIITLPEYYLWEPGALIGVTMDVQTVGPIAGENTTFVTLSGIEYLMPAGKG